ncbi:MAG TPA: DUF1579 domain-containing protein [Longimicrobium sp.]|nr:DUF1579 domain-containing protein [Longimicrobium sp.]
MDVTVQDEHRWLEKLVGDWTWEMDAGSMPDLPAGKVTGTERVRSLGGVWVVCEGSSDYGGEVSESVMTLGFDPAVGRFVGTFAGSMMHHLWVYSGGELDREGDVLRLEAEGPGFEDQGKHVPYRDAIAFRSPDHRVMTSSYRRDDGTWHQFMEMHYRRTSPASPGGES